MRRRPGRFGSGVVMRVKSVSTSRTAIYPTISTTMISSAPPAPPVHGMVARSPDPRWRAMSSIMAVPQEAMLANMNPRLGSIHEMARLASPVSVEKPTKGATTRLAGME